MLKSRQDAWFADRAPGIGKAVFATPGSAASNVPIGGIIGVGNSAAPPPVYPTLPEPGTTIPAIGSPGRASFFLAFKAAVGFDSNTYVVLPTASDGLNFSLSVWVDFGVTNGPPGWTPDQTLGALFNSNHGGGSSFSIFAAGPGDTTGGNLVGPKMDMLSGDAAPSPLIPYIYPSDLTTNAGWVHLMMSAKRVYAGLDSHLNELCTDTFQCYINDTQFFNTTQTLQSTHLAIPYSGGNYLGIDYANGNLPLLADNGLKGALCEYWVSTSFVDWSIQNNRYKFQVTDGAGALQTWAPCSLGSNGAAPFGVRPLAYLSGGAELFRFNRATGGTALTVTTTTSGLFDVDDPPA